MRKYCVLFVVISILGFTQLFAQEKQKIPTDFFMGNWGGTISGEIIDKQPHKPVKKYPFNLELIGHPAPYEIGPFGGGANAWMKMNATWPNSFTLINTSVGCLFPFSPESPIFTISYPVSDPATITGMGYNAVFYLGGFTAEIENKNLIRLISGGIDEQIWTDSWAVGKLYRIYVKKDTLGKTVHINEPIKTDEFTQREIVIPAVPEMPDFPYKIGEMIVAGNTECVFTSENELHLISGEVISFVDKNWWKSVDLNKAVSSEAEITDIELGKFTSKLNEKVDKMREKGYDFEVQTPQAVIAVRGTQFINKVKKDGTTTLTVLDGEVEFSDTEKRKTVLVKKNQKSTIRQGELPSEPVSVDSSQIPIWWK